jgi:mono/diheme cytochrome c family protein
LPSAARRPPQPSSEHPEQEATARESPLFRRFCVRCHGDDGTGNDARDESPQIPDFTDEDWQSRRTDRKLEVSILDGKGTGMPPHRDHVSQDQVRELVAYIRSFGPEARPTNGRTTRPKTDFKKAFQKLDQQLRELEEESRKAMPRKTEE